jgi:hypothetical protein
MQTRSSNTTASVTTASTDAEVQPREGERATLPPEVGGEREVPRVGTIHVVEVELPTPRGGRVDLAPHPYGERNSLPGFLPNVGTLRRTKVFITC